MKVEEDFKKQRITKDSLRREIKRKRDNLTPDEVNEKSKLVKEKLLSLPEFKSARIVAFYASFKKSNEVETEEMIKEAMTMGKTVLVPVTDTVEDKIVFSEIKSLDDMAPGTFDILEPVPEMRKIFPNEAIRLIVVPGIVFDLEGYRIGYGLGYYDKFLSGLAKYVTKVGLAYDFQVVEKIPVEGHDVRLNKIITDERIIECHD